MHDWSRSASTIKNTLTWSGTIRAQKFVILSDPSAKVIREYGLLHPHGKGDTDIALRTTYVLDENGRERWRKVSANVFEIPKSAEVLGVLAAMH